MLELVYLHRTIQPMKNIQVLLCMILVTIMACTKKEGHWSKVAADIPYQIFFPANYDSDKIYPLILFLHGAGERGNDNEKQLVHIAPHLSSDTVQNKFPSILVFPQCPTDGYWAHVNTKAGKWTVKSSNSPTPSMEKVIKLLDKIIMEEKVDKERVYIGGLSMGGFGTFDLLSRKPNTFAAAIPICGGGDTSKVQLYKDVPLWNFHGSMDNVVPVKLSQSTISKLVEVGGTPRYTEYPEGTHNVWTTAFQEKDLLPWLFSQSK